MRCAQAAPAVEALHDVVKSGKARYIGACTMDAWQFERLQNIAERNHWTKFITMQNQYNLIYRMSVFDDLRNGIAYDIRNEDYCIAVGVPAKIVKEI